MTYVVIENKESGMFSVVSNNRTEYSLLTNYLDKAKAKSACEQCNIMINKGYQSMLRDGKIYFGKIHFQQEGKTKQGEEGIIEVVEYRQKPGDTYREYVEVRCLSREAIMFKWYSLTEFELNEIEQAIEFAKQKAKEKQFIAGKQITDEQIYEIEETEGNPEAFKNLAYRKTNNY